MWPENIAAVVVAIATAFSGKQRNEVVVMVEIECVVETEVRWRGERKS